MHSRSRSKTISKISELGPLQLISCGVIDVSYSYSRHYDTREHVLLLPDKSSVTRQASSKAAFA
jgi:hypothetical protein